MANTIIALSLSIFNPASHTWEAATNETLLEAVKNYAPIRADHAYNGPLSFPKPEETLLQVACGNPFIDCKHEDSLTQFVLWSLMEAREGVPFLIGCCGGAEYLTIEDF